MTTPACRGVCLFDYQLKCQKQREGGSNVLLAPRGKRINASIRIPMAREFTQSTQS
jgi:hypothetical protein